MIEAGDNSLLRHSPHFPRQRQVSPAAIVRSESPSAFQALTDPQERLCGAGLALDEAVVD